jgi:flagellar M-ring protein FliF
MISSSRRSARRSALAVAALVALALAVLQFPTSSTASASSAAGQSSATPAVTDRQALSAPAQAQLDQVLGAGHSVITASAGYGTGSSQVTTRYDARHSAVLSQSTVSGPGYRAGTTTNGVSKTVTGSTTPGGQITALSVAVVVDSALRPAPRLATIRALVSAALGLQPARGDRISVVRLPMATAGVHAGTAVASAQPVIPARFAPYRNSGLGAAAALGLLLWLCAEWYITGASTEQRRDVGVTE